ncbi:MAG: hypothetical protein M1834_004724 [Cirrosporium novae-zelandiae]|nr:MAG: hypothetical protein M1834_004724 [Cirrosporium novae-zelandiae]
MSTKSILVLGAGQLGSFVIQALLKHPAHRDTSIAVLLRQSSDPNKQQLVSSLQSQNVSVVFGDLVSSTTAELSHLFSPFHTIIGCMGLAAGKGIQIKIAHAVLDAGLPRYFPWQFGVDYDIIGRGSPQDLFDEQLDVRDVLRAQKKTEWVIVSTGLFTNFLFLQPFGVVDTNEGVVRALGAWGNRITVTGADDIGRLTAEIVFSEPRTKDEIVYVAGDTVSYKEVADIVEEILGKPVQREVWTLDQLQDELKGDPNDMLKKYRLMFAEGKGVSWDMEKTFNARKGIEVQDVKKWAQANLSK